MKKIPWETAEIRRKGDDLSKLSPFLLTNKGTYATDSLNKGKTLTKNGIPVAFLKEKSYYDYHFLFFINRVESKVNKAYHWHLNTDRKGVNSGISSCNWPNCPFFGEKLADYVKNLRIMQKLLEKISIIAMFGKGIATGEK